jgi:hypothetical protein|tara:strand:+ start:919 stop:1026 length:108 start_codon:yes stop_codon:yes gene_type:complete
MNRVLIIFAIKTLIASLSICRGGFGAPAMGFKNNL